jgi:23S rRNA (uridine2552-2'-O)-methyltransferase
MVKGNRWEDHYARRARKEKRLARSVYKLEDIDRKYCLFSRGQRVLDLGCYPGSWSRYSLDRVGPKGEVIGMDLRAPKGLRAKNFHFLKVDVLQLDKEVLALELGPIDVVISDLAPQTTGVKIVDNYRSMELAQKALNMATVMLKRGGHFLCKIFEGEDQKIFKDEFSQYFNQTRSLRPSAVRKGSREMYLLGIKFTK